MYKLYRLLPSGKWKYTDVFNSTLDPGYHGAVEFFDKNDMAWLLTNSDGLICFSSNNNVYSGQYLIKTKDGFKIKE